MSADGLNGYGGNSYARSDRVRGAHHSYGVEDSFHAEDAFRAAMLEAGIKPPDHIICNGALHRFSTNGKPSDTAGWYILCSDGIPAGAFGCWRAGISQKWHANIGRKLTQAETRAYRERVTAIRREHQAEQERQRSAARLRAEDILRRSRPLAVTDGHAYLRDKSLKPCDGLYVYNRLLVVPMRTADGALHSLQFIAPDKTKRFLLGGRVEDCFFVMGKPDSVLVVAEGLANALTIWTATGHAAVCAFSCRISGVRTHPISSVGDHLIS